MLRCSSTTWRGVTGVLEGHILAVSRQTSSVAGIPGASQRYSFAKIDSPIEVPGLLDLQRESFAWLVNNYWGLDSTTDSVHYLAGWTVSAAKEPRTTPLEILTATATRVRDATIRYLDYRHHHQTHPVTTLADAVTHDSPQPGTATLTHRARALHDLNHSPTHSPARTP